MLCLNTHSSEPREVEAISLKAEKGGNDTFTINDGASSAVGGSPVADPTCTPRTSKGGRRSLIPTPAQVSLVAVLSWSMCEALVIIIKIWGTQGRGTNLEGNCSGGHTAITLIVQVRVVCKTVSLHAAGLAAGNRFEFIRCEC